MLYIGADHRGFEFKEKIKILLDKRGEKYVDCGSAKLKAGDDYPLVAKEVAKKVAKDDKNHGILLCGSGNGVAIAANKVSGVRAAVAWDAKVAARAVLEDHANIIAIPADFLSWPKAKAIVEAFLRAKPSKAARHVRRVKQIS